MILVIRPNAKDDILRQYRYYLLEDALETANQFLEAIDESIDMIRKMPEIGAPKQLKNSLLFGLRSFPVTSFEHIIIFYVVQPEALRIVRILHANRDIRKILERERDEKF